MVSDPLPKSADLALSKTGPATVSGGGDVTYRLLVSNTGPDAADGATVGDLVPSGLSTVTWACANPTGGAACPSPVGGTGDVALTIPTFPAGATVTVMVYGKAPAVGAFANLARVNPPPGVADPDPDNNPGGPVITQIPTVTLSGVVFNDNGAGGGSAGDGLKNGSEPGVDPGSLNVVILASDGTVMAVAPVADADGTWSSVIGAATGYTAYITTASPTLGTTIATPAAQLPTGWVITGEHDSLNDGILMEIDARANVAGLNFGVEASNNTIELIKTAFLTGESGSSCATASSPLVYVNKNKDPVDVTWCFKVTNKGNEDLINPKLNDPLLGINNQALAAPASGSLPLKPGASATWFFVDQDRITSLENVATVTMDPKGGGVAVSDTDDKAIFAYVFDPPYGVKTGQVNGVNVIRWNMVWINNSPITATDVLIDDPIQAGMTYRSGSLACYARGSTAVVGTCSDANYSAAQRHIQVTANFGPDLGATNEDNADNELVISFEVTVDNPSVGQSFENQATATWDPEGPGGDGPLSGVTDDNAPGGGDPTPIIFPAVIPTLSEWAMILLGLMLMGMVWRSRSRFGVNR